MGKRFPSIFKDYPYMLHGGDYNPDQWLHAPEVIEEDFRLMKLAGCNTFSVGIFSWVAYEPEEGLFTFDWLDRIMERVAKAGSKVFLATPSGAKPAWLSHAYPEVCRVRENSIREHHHGRHNHCYTSPVYREKTAIIDSLLAERYGQHPALGGWHISNEYCGRCYCDHCLGAFRAWLKSKYATLDALNLAWWSGFWSHTVTSWELIDPRDGSLDGMGLDWNRFVTYQTANFMAQEKAAIRKFSDAPVTTNMMGAYDGLDYWRIAEVCDVIADDSYPQFHDPVDNSNTLSFVGMMHDMHRSMKQGQPFLLMESCPSATNWMPLHKVKRPGMHRMEMLQAVGHGADATMYFQWRKGQGGGEKFHGAVVDHEGTEHTRVFSDVANWGADLRKLAPVVGTSVEAQTALIFDWEVCWALGLSGGPSDNKKQYVETCHQHYKPFWQAGVPVDVIESLADFSHYRLLLAPMLFMLKPGLGERLSAFVHDGGTLVLSYLSGIVDESNRCFRGGWPGDGLRELSGIWAEEVDSIRDSDQQQLRMHASLGGLNGSYTAKDYCMLIHAEGAEVLATYTDDFYAGRPALTYRQAGKGGVYYLAARTEDRFITDFYQAVLSRLDIRSPFPASLPDGVTVQMRTDEETKFFFLINATSQDKDVPASGLTDLFTGEKIQGSVRLGAWGCTVLVGG